MRAQILRLLIALTLGIGLIGPGFHFARAQNNGDIAIGDTVSIGEDGVNMRRTPGTDGDIITTLNSGVMLEILDGPTTASGYTWWMGVILDENSVDQGISGWVIEDALTVEDVQATPTPQTGGTETPTPEPSGSPTPTATPGTGNTTFESAKWVVVVDGPLNLRKNPGLQGSVIRALSTDETATRVDPSELTDRDGYTWINVKTPAGETGWAATDFLDPLSTDPCPNGNCEPVEHQDLLDADAVVVVDGPLNVRSSASVDGDILDTVATGAVLNSATNGEITTAGDYDWLKVDYQGQVAWVAVDFVSVSDETCEVSPCFPEGTSSDDPFVGALGVEVFDGPLNVRDVAGLGGTIVDVLDTGAEAPVDTRAVLTDADGYTWIKIVTADGGGWVATDFVHPLDQVPCGDVVCYPAELSSFIGASGAFVSDGPLNLRSEMGTNSSILMTLENGDYLTIESVAGTEQAYEADGYIWIQVTPAGTNLTGWVAIDFVTAAG
jgi:uncharacterized protein YgiM (DUF1202 family)